MNKKYNILILSNPQNDELMEDIYIVNSFKEDGNIVDVKWVDYDEKLDQNYDIIIRRNTWVEDENETKYFKLKNDYLIERLNNKNIRTINLEGLDGQGKMYLCKLFKLGKKVIPTINNINELSSLGNVGEYVLKDNNSFGSGLGQKFIKADEIIDQFKVGQLIQPKLKFKSEIQCYFVGNKLMYVYEYSPSKYPDYPTPRIIQLNWKEKKLAVEFAKISELKYGFKRIDFLRLENNELILLEIEDNSPHMNLEKLDYKFRNKVIQEYKKNIYEYLMKGK